MCGEFEDEDFVDEQMFSRFLKLAQTFGVRPEPGNKASDLNIAEAEDRRVYMEQLFRAGLVRSTNDAQHIPEDGDRMDALALQAVVFGRLAGFLAGQLPPESNLMKASMESFMDGYNEALEKNKALAEEEDHHHHHGHAHSH